MNYFNKVSYGQFCRDAHYDDVTSNIIDEWYDNIKMPAQSSNGSAGCDFYLYRDLDIAPHSKVMIPTGVRWITNKWDMNKVLMIFPRSGLGCKYGLRLMNSVGIIDASYYGSDNEGHIILWLENPSDETIHFETGDRIVQGIVTEYHLPSYVATLNDKRNGGLGSSGR